MADASTAASADKGQSILHVYNLMPLLSKHDAQAFSTTQANQDPDLAD